MKTEVKSAAENEVELLVEVPRDAVKSMYERTLSRLARDMVLPGFRKGRVPRDLVVRHLTEDYIRSQTLEDALPEWYESALDEAAVDAVSMPEIDFSTFDQDAEFAFSAKVQVRPSPTLGEYKGLEIPKRSIEVTDAQVEAQLTMMQERFASLKPVEDRSVADGDFVLVDLAGHADGQPIEGAQANDYMVEVGRGGLIPGFEENLRGAAAGDDRRFDVTFPEDYGAEHLRSKAATFDVKVKEIKEKVVPELDDAFAADVSEFETIDELRADIRQRLETAQGAAAERDFRGRAVDAAVANATLTVPPAMVAREAHHLYHDLESAVGEQGMTMDDYLGALDKTPEQVEEELKPRAELVVKRRLVLDAIVVEEGLDVTDDEVRERIKADAETLGRDPNQLVLDIYAAGRQDLIRDELLMAKAVGVVAEHATAVPFTGDGGQAEADGGDAAAPAAED